MIATNGRHLVNSTECQDSGTLVSVAQVQVMHTVKTQQDQQDKPLQHAA